MPVSVNILCNETYALEHVGVSDNGYIFTELYELILNDSSLVQSELIELHKLILRKLNNSKPPARPIRY